jgi:rod shape-determining protein MreD
LIWILVAFLGEVWLAPLLTIRGIAPDFTTIALVILALAAGTGPGTIGGFVIGLVQDLYNPPLLGLHALCKSLLGFGLGTLRGHLVFGMPAVEGIMIALAVFGQEAIFLLVGSNLGDSPFFAPLFTQSLPIALYSGLMGIFTMRLMELLGLLRPED